MIVHFLSMEDLDYFLLFDVQTIYQIILALNIYHLFQDEESHAHLAEQFKSHTIHRVYISLTSGVPSPSSGRIEVPIARDPNNRVRMAAVAGSINSKHVRYAASR